MVFTKHIVQKTTWMNFTETLQIDMGVLIDPISVMMLLVVSIVSLMVHIYSRGYMKGDEGYTRFFAFLGLFSFSMFGLVLATNLIPNLYFLGISWGFLFLINWLLLHKTVSSSSCEKSFYCNSFCRFRFLNWNLNYGILHRYI